MVSKSLKLHQIKRIYRWSGTTFIYKHACKITPSL